MCSRQWTDKIIACIARMKSSFRPNQSHHIQIHNGVKNNLHSIVNYRLHQMICFTCIFCAKTIVFGLVVARRSAVELKFPLNWCEFRKTHVQQQTKLDLIWLQCSYAHHGMPMRWQKAIVFFCVTVLRCLFELPSTFLQWHSRIFSSLFIVLAVHSSEISSENICDICHDVNLWEMYSFFSYFHSVCVQLSFVCSKIASSENNIVLLFKHHFNFIMRLDYYCCCFCSYRHRCCCHFFLLNFRFVIFFQHIWNSHSPLFIGFLSLYDESDNNNDEKTHHPYKHMNIHLKWKTISI